MLSLFFVIFSLMPYRLFATPHFTNTIEFLHSTANRDHTQQTLFLFSIDRFINTKTSKIQVRLNSSSPQTGINTFRVTRDTQSPDLVFISLMNKRLDLDKRCNPDYNNTYILDLLILQSQMVINSIQLNILILNEIPCGQTNKTDSIHMNIEYIFQLESGANFGLIKDDMLRNGIVAIVKIINNSHNKSLDIILDRSSSLVALKKFLPNFYMLRLLSKSSIIRDEYFEVKLYLVEGEQRLDTGVLSFKLVKTDDLRIGFGQPNGVLDVTVPNVFTDYSASGAYLYQIKANLNELIFSFKNSEYNVDLVRYLKNNIRFSISETNASNVELDSYSGHVTLKRASLNTEFISLNVTATDKRKLFRSDSLHINIRVPSRRGEGRGQQLQNQQQIVLEKYIHIESSRALVLVDLTVHDSVNEFDRLGECWINGDAWPQVEKKFYLNLNNRVFTAFSRLEDLQMRLIECQLISSNIWLKFLINYNTNQQNKTSDQIIQNSRTADLTVKENTLFKKQRATFDLKHLFDVIYLNQKHNHNTQLVFSFSQGQASIIAGQLFQVDPINGYVTYNQKLLLTWPDLNLVRLTFDIRLVEVASNVSVGLDINSDTPFLMQEIRDLTLIKDIPVFFNLLRTSRIDDVNDFQTQINFEAISKLNGNFYPILITNIKTENLLEFKVVQVCPPPIDLISIDVVQVLYLDLDRSLKDKPAATDLFTIYQGHLVYKPQISSTAVNKNNVYYLTINACSKNSQSVQINLTVSIQFDLSATYARFTAPVIEIQAKRDIDLKSLIAGYWLFDFSKLSVTFQADSVNAEFELNPVNGLLGMLDTSRNSEINVSMFHAGQKITSTYLKVIKQLPEHLTRTFNTTVFNSQFNFKETVDVVQLPTSDDYSRVICVHIEQLLCQKLFTINSGFLKLNRTVLLQKFTREQTIKLILKQKNNKKLSVNVLIQLPSDHQQLPKVFSLGKIVTIVKKSVSVINIHIANLTKRLDYNRRSMIRILRVKNLVTNTEVIGFDYKLAFDQQASYIQIQNMNGIEVDQVYSFDVDLGTGQAHSFYLVRSDLVELNSQIVKSPSGQFITELSESQRPLGSYEQSIFVIDSANGSEMQNFKISDGCLWVLTEGLKGFHEVGVVEFVVDKMSLRVMQMKRTVFVVELDDKFYVEVEMPKSEVRSGSLVYQANDVEFVQLNGHEMFRIDNGNVVYMVSNGLVEVGVFGFEVAVVGRGVIYVDVSVVDDEPVVVGLFQDVFVQEFEMASNQGVNSFVGRIEILTGENHELEYEILDLIGMERFRLDKKNGMLFTSEKIIDDISPEFYSLNVGVNGRVGLKNVSGTVNVVVSVKSSEMSTEGSQSWRNVEVERLDLNGVKEMLLGEKYLNEMQNRYRLIPTGEERPSCEINWLDGRLSCKTHLKKDFVIHALVYQVKEKMNKFVITKYVEININSSKNSDKTIPQYPEVHLNVNLTRELIGPLKLGTIVSDLYENIIGFKQRYFCINHDNRSASSILNYFELNTVNGQLTLVDHIPLNVNRLSQQFSLVQQEFINNVFNFKVVRIFTVNLLVKTNQVYNFPTKVDRIADFQATNSVNVHNELKLDLDIPVHRSDQLGLLRLFRINDNSSNIYTEIQTESATLFVYGLDTDWLFVNTEFFQTDKSKHSFNITSRDSLTNTFKSTLVNVNLIEFSEKFEYLFKVDLSNDLGNINSGQVVLDLSSYFANSFKYIVLNDTRNLDYEASTGQVRFVRRLPQGENLRVIELKLLTVDSDVRMGRIHVRTSPKMIHKRQEKITLHISKQVAAGSSIYMNFEATSTIEKLVTPVGDDVFRLDETGSRVLVGNSGLGRLEMVEFELCLEMSDKILVVRIIVLENLLKTVDFSRMNYFFSWNNSNNTEIGRMAVTPSEHMKFVRMQSLELTQIKCLETDENLTANQSLFSLINNTNLIALSLNKSVFDQSNLCQSYYLSVSANVTTDTSTIVHSRTITTGVYIQVDTQQLRIAQKMSTLQTSYNKIIEVNDVFMPQKSIFSIDLFELTKWTSIDELDLKVSLVRSDLSHLEFNLNNRNGLLLIKIKSQFKKFIQRSQFRINIFSKHDLVSSFTLNLYFYNKFSVVGKNQVYFINEYYKITEPEIRLDSLLFNEITELNQKIVFRVNDKKFRIGSDSSLQLIQSNESPMTRILHVSACNELSCDYTNLFIHLKTDHKLNEIQSTTVKVTSAATSTTKITTIQMISSDGFEGTEYNMIIFIVLVSLIALTSSVTILAAVYLRLTRSRPVKSTSRKQLEMSVSSVDQNGSLSSSEGSSTFLPSQSVGQGNLSFFNNEVFESEFEMLRFTLNWEPTFGQFKTVISDFEMFEEVVQRPFVSLGGMHHYETEHLTQVCDNQLTIV